MTKEKIIDSAKTSLKEYFSTTFENAFYGNTELNDVIKNLTENIPLTVRKEALSNTWYSKNIAPKNEFLSSGTFVYSEDGQYIFLAASKIGNLPFEFVISNILNAEESINNISKSYDEYIDSKESIKSKMLPSNLTLSNLFFYAFAEISAGKQNSRTSFILDLFLNTSMSVKQYESGLCHELDSFFEEAYIIMASELLKKKISKSNFGKKTKVQIFSFANTVFLEYLIAFFKSNNKDLKELFFQYDFSNVDNLINNRIETLLASFPEGFFKASSS